MKINLKYFKYSSVRFRTTKFKYSIGESDFLYFDNYFQNFEEAKDILEMLKVRFKKLKLTKDIKQLINVINAKNGNKESNFKIFESDRDVERILKVILNYGMNRDFIIEKIFGGSFGSNIGTENESREQMIPINNYLFQVPISKTLPNKERLICIAKKYNDGREEILPLFIDVNHNLFSQTKLRYRTKYCISEAVYSMILPKITQPQ